MDSTTLMHIARKQAEKHGLMSLTVPGLCDAANIPVGSFHHVAKMKFAVLIEALRGTVPVPVEGVASERRVSGPSRRSQMVAAALSLAREHGYDRVTSPMVADAVGLSKASVMHRFGTMDEMRRAVMREAVKTGDALVVAQGLAARDDIAVNAPENVRAAALEHLAHL